MKITQIMILFFILYNSNAFSQQKYTLSGIVKEASSNESIIGVTIFIPELNTGVSTNEYGFYSITIPSGDYTIQVSSIGFQELVQKINLDKNLKIDFNPT